MTRKWLPFLHVTAAREVGRGNEAALPASGRRSAAPIINSGPSGPASINRPTNGVGLVDAQCLILSFGRGPLLLRVLFWMFFAFGGAAGALLLWRALA